MRKIVLVIVALAFCISMISCAPVTLSKCVTEYKYTPDGKLASDYKECIAQTPEKTAPVHLKHQELYE